MMYYLLTNKPCYLLVDEIDKMTCRDRVFLLNVMETHSERNHTMDAAGLPHTIIFPIS